MDSTLDRLVQITQKYLDERGHPDGDVVLNASSALCQDAYIFGIDVDDYVQLLEKNFGDVIRQIPWLTYTDQTHSFRGCSAVLIVPIWLFYRLFRKILRGGELISHPRPREFPLRLELGHIAAVIDRGEWFEP